MARVNTAMLLVRFLNCIREPYYSHLFNIHTCTPLSSTNFLSKGKVNCYKNIKHIYVFMYFFFFLNDEL